MDHKCHQKCSYARKAEEFDAHQREGVSVTMEMKTRDDRQEGRLSPDAGRGKG